MTRKLIKTITGKYGDGILSIAASFIQKGTFLIVTIVLARIFGPKLFGEYAFLKQAFDVLIVFVLFGGDKSLIYFSAISKRDGLNKLIGVIKFVTIVVIVLFLSSLFIKDTLLANYDFSHNLFFLIIFAATILLNIIILFIESYFIGIKSLKTYFKSVIIAAILYLPLSYFFGYRYGIIGVFVALFIDYFVQLIYIYLKEGQHFNKRELNDIKKDLKQLYTFSLPIGIGELLFNLTGFFTSIVLLQNANFEELGIYNVAIRMVMFIVFIPNLLNNILLSYLSTEINKENFLIKTFFLNLLLSGIVGFIFYIFSNHIFALFGTGYDESLHDVFINLLYGVIPLCSSYVLLQYLISIKKRWSYLFFRLLRQGLTIGLFVLYIKLDFLVDAVLLSKCFVYSNYISLFLLLSFIIINYFYERKETIFNL
jgi:O-antigen/teichoic acid export membrane protein